MKSQTLFKRVVTCLSVIASLGSAARVTNAAAPSDEERVARAVYARLGEYTAGSGTPLVFNLSDFRQISPQEYAATRWVDAITMYGGDMINTTIERRPYVVGGAPVQKARYTSTWTTGPAWADTADGATYGDTTFAAAFDVARQNEPTMGEFIGVTSFTVTLSLQDRQRQYRAMLLWLQPADAATEVGSDSFIPLDNIAQGISEIVHEADPSVQSGDVASAPPTPLAALTASGGSCAAWSLPVNFFPPDTQVGKYTGSAKFYSTCSCSSTCVSTCVSGGGQYDCKYNGRCRKFATELTTTGGESVGNGEANGAVCASGFGCAGKKCPIPFLCGCFLSGVKVKVSIKPISSDVEFTFDGDPEFKYGQSFKAECAKCTTAGTNPPSTGGTASGHAVSGGFDPGDPTPTPTTGPTSVTPTPTGPTPTPTPAPLTRNAQYVNQFVPTQMVAGQVYSVSLTFRNTGNTTWSPAPVGGCGYLLGSQGPQDNQTWGRGRAPLPAAVAPGETTTIPFDVTAPATAGTYNFQWKVLDSCATWFGETSPDTSITVFPAGVVLPTPGPTPTPRGTAWLVVGSTSPMAPEDSLVQTRLTQLGFNVTPVYWGGNTAPANVAGVSLVVLSNTSNPVGNVSFQGVNVPVLSYKGGGFAALGLTKDTVNYDRGNSPSQTQVSILRPALAGGLTGTVTIASSPATFTWGYPNANGIAIATIAGATRQYSTVFGYEKGATMYYGYVAAARRVGWLFNDGTSLKMNATGWSLFEAAVNWVTAPPQP